MRLSFLLGGIVLGLVVPATGEEAWRPFASAAPEMVPLDDTETLLGMTAAFRAGEVRASGRRPAEEIGDTARHCAAGGDLARRVLGIRTRAPYTFYLFDDYASALSVLRLAPDLTAADLEFASRTERVPEGRGLREAGRRGLGDPARSGERRRSRGTVTSRPGSCWICPSVRR